MSVQSSQKKKKKEAGLDSVASGRKLKPGITAATFNLQRHKRLHFLLANS